MESNSTSVLLPDTIPLMVLSGAVQFPRALMPLFIFEKRYRQMLDYALRGERMFGIANAISEVDPEIADEPVQSIFTAGLVRACVKHDDGTSHLMLQGLQRVEIVGWEQVAPFRVASIIPIENITTDPEVEQQLATELIALCQKSIADHSDVNVSRPMRKILEVLEDPAEITDMIGHNFIHPPAKRQELLEIASVKERLEFLIQNISTGAGEL